MPPWREFDTGHLLVSLVPNMVEQARFAAETDAHSYRDFKVGAAVLAVNDVTHETAVITAGNLKSRHKAKVCAERKALQQARKIGYTQAASIVVAGTTDAELIREVTGVATPTLHPCGECQNMFDSHPLMRDDTLIITTGLEDDIYQVHNFVELKGLYSIADLSVLETQEGGLHDFSNWEQRVALYGHMRYLEQRFPVEERRSSSKMAQLALVADIS